MVLCDRENTGSDIPTLEQLEDRLYDQELALIARRYLRDIRREAAIIQP
jgi:peptidyl-prolyl cis-trans isomerase SurA